MNMECQNRHKTFHFRHFNFCLLIYYVQKNIIKQEVTFMIQKPTPLEIGRVLFVNTFYTAYIRNYNKDFYFAGETHDFWELVYIIKGNATVTKNNKIIHLKAGDIIFHPPMEFHRLWANDSDFTVLIMSFVASGPAMEDLGKKILTLNILQESLLIQLKHNIDESFVPLDGIYLKPDEEKPLAVQLAMSRFELFLLDVLKSNSTEEKIDDTKNAMSFSKIIKVMNSHIGEDLTVEDLARLSNNSVSNLKRICHKYTGVGPAKHFLRLKIICAISLLENGENVNEVSEKLGFVNPSYFSVVFKRETGSTPSDIKNTKGKVRLSVPEANSDYKLYDAEIDKISAC